MHAADSGTQATDTCKPDLAWHHRHNNDSLRNTAIAFDNEGAWKSRGNEYAS